MVVAAFVTSFAQVGIKKWLFASTPDICTPFNANSLTCPQMRSFFTASVLWCVLTASPGLCQELMGLLAFLAGASLAQSGNLAKEPCITLCSTRSSLAPCCPFSCGLTCGACVSSSASRPCCSFRLRTDRASASSVQYPSSWLRDVNFPIAFSGPLFIPGVPALNTAVWVLVNFLTRASPTLFEAKGMATDEMSVALQNTWYDAGTSAGGRRCVRGWGEIVCQESCALILIIRHSQYNYILSVGLDTGTVIGVIIVFLCLQLPKGGTLTFNWWGNLVWQESQSRVSASPVPAPVDLVEGSTLAADCLDILALAPLPILRSARRYRDDSA
jgi:hypothetical protein